MTRLLVGGGLMAEGGGNRNSLVEAEVATAVRHLVVPVAFRGDAHRKDCKELNLHGVRTG